MNDVFVVSFSRFSVLSITAGTLFEKNAAQPQI